MSRGTTKNGNDYCVGSNIKLWGLNNPTNCDKCGTFIAADVEYFAVETGDGYCSHECMYSDHGDPWSEDPDSD